MKRILSISFAVLYLFSATELSELTKLPSLWEHYQMHQETHEDLDLWSFLNMHYASGDHQDDHDHHLPFQDGADYVVLNFPAIFAEAYQILQPQGDVYISQAWPHMEAFLPSELSFEIWNPPQ